MSLTNRATKKFREDGLIPLIKASTLYIFSDTLRFGNKIKNDIYYKSYICENKPVFQRVFFRILFSIMFIIDNIVCIIRLGAIIIPNNGNYDVVKIKNRDVLLTIPRVPDKQRCWSYERLKNAYTKEAFVEIDTGDVVFDIGAHLGIFSRVAAKSADRVIAVDPNASVDDCLYENTKNYPNITVVDKAAWNKKTDLNLSQSYFPSESSAIDIDSYDVRKRFTVEASTVAQIAKELDIEKIDFLKIEAEGAEPEILEGALDGDIKIDKIVVDCSPERNGQSTDEQIIPIIENNKFEVRDTPSSHYVFGKLNK